MPHILFIYKRTVKLFPSNDVWTASAIRQRWSVKDPGQAMVSQRLGVPSLGHSFKRYPLKSSRRWLRQPRRLPSLLAMQVRRMIYHDRCRPECPWHRHRAAAVYVESWG